MKKLTPENLLISLSIRHMRHLGADRLARGDEHSFFVLVAEEGAAEIGGGVFEAGAVEDAGFADFISCGGLLVRAWAWKR
jgi:hypothetical protein